MQLYLWWGLCTLMCSCTSGGVYVHWSAAVPLVEFMYLEVQLSPWWSLCTLKCSCISSEVYVPWCAAVPLVEFMYHEVTLKCSCTSGGVYVPWSDLEVQLYLWWSLCTLKCSCTSGGVYVPQCTSGGVFYLVVTHSRMPSERYQRRIRSLLLCSCDVFPVLITPLFADFAQVLCTSFCFRLWTLHSLGFSAEWYSVSASAVPSCARHFLNWRDI